MLSLKYPPSSYTGSSPSFSIYNIIMVMIDIKLDFIIDRCVNKNVIDLNGAVKRVIKSNNLLFIGVKMLVHLVQEGCLLVLLDLSLIEDWDINRNISVRDGE